MTSPTTRSGLTIDVLDADEVEDRGAGPDRARDESGRRLYRVGGDVPFFKSVVRTPRSDNRDAASSCRTISLNIIPPPQSPPPRLSLRFEKGDLAASFGEVVGSDQSCWTASNHGDIELEAVQELLGVPFDDRSRNDRLIK